MTADWALFWVTLVYVVATCVICYFNCQSTNATRDQVKEMKRQYEDEKRLNLLPFFQVIEIPKVNYPDGWMSCELLNESQKQTAVGGQFYFSIQNIGKGIAKQVEFQWKGVAKGNADVRVVSLPVGNLRKAELNILAYSDNGGLQQNSAQLGIKYCDLFDNYYTQTVTLFFVLSPSEIKFLKCYIDAPVSVGRKDEKDSGECKEDQQGESR